MTATDLPLTEVCFRIEVSKVNRLNVDDLAAEIRAFLATVEPAPRVFVLDCEPVRFVDSSAIAAVIRLHGRLASMGTRLEVANAAPSVRRSIEVLGLAERLGVR